MIYIASPYTDPDPEVMQRRYEAVLRYCVHLVQQEAVPYSPIVNFHQMAHHFDLPKDRLYWRKVNATMLRRADRLDVLCLPEWNDSTGIREEINDADVMYITVGYVVGDPWWNASEMPL